MVFNSLSFAIFLPLVFIAYWAMPHKYRWVVLFVSSYYFYMSWNVKYVGLILFTTVISFLAALMLERTENKKTKKWLLAGTLAACLGVLFFFKYFNFVSSCVTDFLGLFSIRMHPVTLKLLLPVGISFYTFQTLSYVIDVYRGEVKAEKHFGIYATFISFFPQLVAGPIERTKNLLPQIKKKQTFLYEKAIYGLKLMAWGFFKKMVIADTLAGYVDSVFNSIYDYKGLALAAAAVLFAIQIYCDFSGYSDIAIGTAKLFGMDLMTNFKSPYLSASIKEFWGRWHISLSTWFRDYIYIPLGGNRVSAVRHKWNLIVTFLVSGLWHGANGTFVLWGGVHGIAQAAESAVENKKRNADKSGRRGIFWLLRVAAVFLFCCFAWIFFRAQSIGEAWYAVCHLFDGIADPYTYLLEGYKALGIGKAGCLKCVVLIAILFVYDAVSLKKDVIVSLEKAPTVVRWGVYILLTWMVLLLTPFGGSEFLYFQF